MAEWLDAPTGPGWWSRRCDLFAARLKSTPPGADSSDGWAFMHRVGKSQAGRLLDGRDHLEVPRTTASPRDAA